MFKKFQEVLNLVRETGDRLIIMDQEGEPYVVMNLANYKQLLREEARVVKLTEEELLEKINRIVASWKNAQPDLSDYDLAQFRIDTIRRPATEKRTVYEPIPDSRAQKQEALLAQVIDSSADEGEEDVYYPEPEQDQVMP